MAKMAGINEADGRIIKDLKGLLVKELPQVEALGPYERGYVVDESGAVTGLSLAGCGLGDAGLAAASQALAALTGLQSLDLRGNQLTDVSALAALTGLQSLDLGYNPLTDVSALAALTGLQSLNLFNNKLTDVSALAVLTGLQSLDLAGNKLTDVSALAALTGLQSLQLHNNGIKDLPEWITQRGMEIYCDNRIHETGIDLENNPLETPPLEIVKQGREAIERYFRQLRKSEAKTKGPHYLFEAKLLIIGEAGGGKTTFARKLKDPNAEMPKTTESTHGIDVSKWSFEITRDDFPKLKSLNIAKTRFYLNLWDFGGQEIYHGTHQFFFSRDSLYTLLADTREQKADFNYWLLTTEQLAGTSPLIIVLNKREGHEWRIDKTGLMGRYGEIIKEVLTIDLSRPEEIPALQKSVKYWFSTLAMIGDRLPESWVDIREDLAKEERKEKKFITYKEFRGICAKRGMTDIEDVRVLSRYYDKIGVVTHFIDDSVLQERVYIDSNWLVQNVYRLLDNEDAKKQWGTLTESQIKTIWKDNEIYQETDKLVQLMLRFGLLFRVKDRDTYIVPEHLKHEKPYERWPYEDGEVLEFHYEFGKYMPKGLMAQLIVELHHHITDYNLVWWRGVNVEYNGAKAEVVETYGRENTFVIRVSGENRRDLLVIVREHFEQIIGKFKKLNPDKLVPCNCAACLASDDPKFHFWDELQNLANRNITSFPCGKNCLPVDIPKLLGQYGIIEKEEREEKKGGGDIYINYGKNVAMGDGARHIHKGNRYKFRDVQGDVVAIGNEDVGGIGKDGSQPDEYKKRIPSTVWRIVGSFVAVFLVSLAVFYVPEWKVKGALLAGAVAASLSIIFSPKTWHRRTALCLLILVGAAQFGFGLYGHLNPSPGASGGGYLVLSGPAVIVQVLIVLAAIIIYVTGERFSKRNE